jgi:RNA polymerase sigma-70 factor (ECF subfamily)
MSEHAEKAIDLAQELANGFTATAIRRKAKRLVGHGRFTEADRPDIEHELKIAVFMAFDQFDPQVGHWNVFMTTVVERAAGKLLAQRKAEKREHTHNVASLSALVEDFDGELVPLSTQIGEEHREPMTGRVRRSDEESVDMAVDVDFELARLPPELRDLCESLKEKSVAEISRELGIPRSTLRDRICEIREYFEPGEIYCYLQKISAISGLDPEG